MADKELTTEEKADIIDKIDKAEEQEEIPDYDVTEEQTDSKSDEDDKSLAKTKDNVEHKQLTNREKRQLRKKRLAEKFDAKDTLIRQQNDQINALAARLNEFDGRISQVDQAQLLQAWNETQAAFNLAQKEHTEAFSTGDGNKATSAMEKMYEARRKLDELQAINARNQSVVPRNQQVQQNRPDPIVVSRAQEWADFNPWFKNGGHDDDSAIADTIAAKLVKEGYDPKSDDYWDELDDRLSQKGIGSSEETQTQSERERQSETPVRRKSPPVNGGSRRGDLSGAQKITLPTVYINTLKDNGYWNDKKVRDRMIKRYLDGQKQREADGAR